MRTVFLATFAHALLLVTAPAFAQDQTNPPASPASGAITPPTTNRTVPTLLGSKITGLKLFDKNGEHIGSLKDILVTAIMCSSTSSRSGAASSASAKKLM